MRPRSLILIVEDEPDLLMLLRVVLETNGYDTALAADGVTALNRIDAERPDLVLLDLMLPVMDGWAVLEEVRSRAEPPPVIVCSASRTIRDLAVASDKGAEAIIAKPIDMDLLLQAVADALEERRRSILGAPESLRQRSVGFEGMQPA
jgi:CheY-like chemotaxis protein